MNEKLNWLINLPQKYKLDSNDKVEALVNGDVTNKVYFGPRRIGKTHMLLLDLAYYLKSNSNKRTVLVSPNHMTTTINYNTFVEMIRDVMEDEIQMTTRNPNTVRMKNGSILYFLHSHENMRGHRFNAIFLDNLDYVSDRLFENVLMCTDFSEEAIIIANQTSVQEIDRAMAILRGNN